MALPTTAAPTRPAPTPQPQPGWKLWAAAGVTADATLPVAAMAARARAAILVLNDIIKLHPGLKRPLWSACPLDGGFLASVRIRRCCLVPTDFSIAVPVAYTAGELFGGAVGELLHIKVIDLGEELAKRARAVRDQLLALLGRGEPGIADGAAGVQVLRLPGKGRRPLRRQPAIALFHRQARRAKVGDVFLAHLVGKAREHDRGFHRAAMDAVAQLLVRKQPRRHAEA